MCAVRTLLRARHSSQSRVAAGESALHSVLIG